MFFGKPRPRTRAMKITPMFNENSAEYNHISLETKIAPPLSQIESSHIHELDSFGQNTVVSIGTMRFTQKHPDVEQRGMYAEIIGNNVYEPEIHYTIELTKMTNRESSYLKRLKQHEDHPSLNTIQTYVSDTVHSSDIIDYSSSHAETIIPLHCYTCWHCLELPPIMQKNYDTLKEKNPTIIFHLYDEIMCREFIETHFEKDVLDAYDKLVPSSYKSDLWRYCILYKYGGIYLDIKYTSIDLFSFADLCYKEQFVLDSSNYWEENQYGIYTAFMIVKPENPILKQCICEIVKNTREELYGWNALYPTGPGLLGKKYFYDDLKQNVDKHQDVQLFFINNQIMYYNKPILKVYDGYRTEQHIYQNNLHYSVLWDRMAIYNKRIIPLVEPNIIMRNTSYISIALIVHVGNMKIFNEMETTIDNVISLQYTDYNLDIYFNVIDCITQENIQYLRHNYPNATIIQSENYGFDIGSFFHILDNIKTRGLHYDYVLKLHTKTNQGLRNKLTTSIAGSTSAIQQCLRLFKDNPNIGCIGAKDVSCIDSTVDFERNVKYLQMLLERHFPNIKHVVSKKPYVSGTMFWMRFDLIKQCFMYTNIKNIYNSFNNSYSFDWNWYYFANKPHFKCLPYNKIRLIEHYNTVGKKMGVSGNLLHCIQYSTKSVVLRDAMIEHAYERFFSYMLEPMGYITYFL